MEFGVPKEVRDLEMRVGLAPSGVLSLSKAGHEVYVESKAGSGAGFMKIIEQPGAKSSIRRLRFTAVPTL